MRFRTQNVNLPGNISLDGWEVLLGGAIACFVVGGTLRAVRALVVVGAVLLVLWVFVVFAEQLGWLKPITRKPPADGGGAGTLASKPPKRKK